MYPLCRKLNIKLYRKQKVRKKDRKTDTDGKPEIETQKQTKKEFKSEKDRGERLRNSVKKETETETYR